MSWAKIKAVVGRRWHPEENYSHRTEQAYVAWVKRYIDFHGMHHSAEMGEPKVNRFLTHLAVRERLAAST